jgi:hypothetical protein
VAEEAARPTATAKGQVKRQKLMVSRRLWLVKTPSSTSIAAGCPAKPWVSFGPISRGRAPAVPCQPTGQSMVTRPSRHARHAVTSQYFLKIRGQPPAGRGPRRGRQCSQRALVLRKPLICRQFRTDLDSDHGVFAVHEHRRVITPLPYTLGFWSHNLGGGVSFRQIAWVRSLPLAGLRTGQDKNR